MYTILFDGVCNLCNASINFIIDRDKHNKFAFAPLQSVAGSKILHEHAVAIPDGDFDSIILVKNNKVYKKSSAALEIARDLSGLWPVFYVFKIVPSPIRDIFYDLIARNRYKLFGRSDTCRMPTPELQQKFLS
jgi:predicted DCC family thiol-disulfide oxidoreductase YuxK